MRTLTSGAGKPRHRQSRRKARSRSLRVRSRPSGPVGKPNTSAWRTARRSSLDDTSPRPPGADATRPRSAIVRAGVVTGIPPRSVTSAGESGFDRCTRIPWRLLLPLSLGIETSTDPFPSGSSSHRSAALRWLNAAPQRASTVRPRSCSNPQPSSGATRSMDAWVRICSEQRAALPPQASTAAIHRASWERAE